MCTFGFYAVGITTGCLLDKGLSVHGVWLARVGFGAIRYVPKQAVTFTYAASLRCRPGRPCQVFIERYIDAHKTIYFGEPRIGVGEINDVTFVRAIETNASRTCHCLVRFVYASRLSPCVTGDIWCETRTGKLYV